MKTILFLFFAIGSLSAQVATNEVASCCEREEGRCTGSSSCSACRNCSRCAHCSNGGSCGVCSSSQSYYAPPARKKVVKTTGYSTPKQSVRAYYDGEILFVTIENVNLREGPGTHYPVLQTLGKNEPVLFRKKAGDWIFIEVEKSGVKGYVNVNYLK